MRIINNCGRMRPILENIHNSEGGGNEEMGFEIWLQLQILIISIITPTNNYPIGNKSSNNSLMKSQ